MTHHLLLEYIRDAKDCGATDAEIGTRLHEAGWYRVDIQDALELHHKLADMAPKPAEACPVSVPKPTMAERLVPSSYDPHLVAVAVLSFAIAFVGYLWIAN